MLDVSVALAESCPLLLPDGISSLNVFDALYKRRFRIARGRLAATECACNRSSQQTLIQRFKEGEQESLLVCVRVVILLAVHLTEGLPLVADLRGGTLEVL